jgi:hypothetical protein
MVYNQTDDYEISKHFRNTEWYEVPMSRRSIPAGDFWYVVS